MGKQNNQKRAKAKRNQQAATSRTSTAALARILVNKGICSQRILDAGTRAPRNGSQ